MSHACHRFLKCQKTLTFCSLLAMCRIPCTCHAKPHLNLQNVVRACRALYILTSKCASRHKGVCFFDISTSKHAPNPSAFSTFHFQMCFAPQRHATFRYLNFQKCSEHRAHPSTMCFVRFDFDMCFAPRRRALFRHLNFQKCCEA